MIFHRTLSGMGTRMDIVVPGINHDDGDILVQEINTIIKGTEHVLSRYDTKGPVFFLNLYGHKKPVQCPPLLTNMLKKGLHYYKLTSGLFHIGAQTFAQAIKDGNHQILEQLKNLELHEIIEIDENRNEVFFKNPNLSIDFGGIGKGFVLDRVKEVLLEKEIDTGFVSFGESSILAVGKHPHGDYWPLGIKNLFDQQQNVYVFKLTDSALSTSGLLHGKEWHIFNPLTQTIKTGKKHVSVESASAEEAEVLSTAILCDEGFKDRIAFNNFLPFKAVIVTYNGQNNYTVEEFDSLTTI